MLGFFPSWLPLFSILALLTAYPALYWLTAEPSFLRLLAVELWFSVIFGGYNGAMVVFLTEIMPAHIRTSGFSVSVRVICQYQPDSGSSNRGSPSD